MAHLANLLGEPERKVRKVIDKLEQMSGYNSEDVRLLADINLETKNKIASLGLDPADTTGEELYEALKVKLSKDLARVEKAWGLDDSQHIIGVLTHAASNEQVLAIKCAAIKRQLIALPPKKTLKLLGYRSLDSMLKREDMREVLASALEHESMKWNSSFAHRINSLRASDYELRKIIFFVSPELHHTTQVPLMAAVGISEKRLSSPAGEVMLALEAEAKLLGESHYLSANQFSKNFGLLAQRIFMGHVIAGTDIAGQSFIDMHAAVRLEHPLEPHRNFASLHPALYWWKDTAHLAHNISGPVSMHLSDCLENLTNKVAYDSREARNFSAELKHKLLNRYCNYDAIKNYISGSIDDTFITLESISSKELAPQYEEIFN